MKLSDIVERRNRSRLLLERIRDLDPTLLECGPDCAHFDRHSPTTHAHNVANLLVLR